MAEPKRMGRPVGTGLHGRKRYLTEAELAAFKKAREKSGKMWGVFFSLLWYFALRVGEACRLRWDDVDFAAHQIKIVPEKNGTTRVYNLPERIERGLKMLKREVDRHPEKKENPYIFPGRLSKRTGHVTTGGAQRMFQALLKKAKVETKHGIHDVRHTRASMMLKDGNNIVQVRDWLRHRFVRSTEVYLSDVSQAEHERELERRERFL